MIVRQLMTASLLSLALISLPGSAGTAWWAREDSNLQPDRYERSALTIELRARAPATSEPLSHTMTGAARQSPAAPAQGHESRALRGDSRCA